MKRRHVIAALLALLPVLAIATLAQAAKPLDVHIEAPTGISGPAPDPFTASGPAVDGGLLSATGVVYTFDLAAYGPPAGTFIMLSMVKQFVFDDGSGTLDVKLVVKLDLITHITTGHWQVLSGTGSIAGLKGNGKLLGIPIDPGVSILDIYDGKLH